MSLEEVHEESHRGLPSMGDIQAWMTKMQRSMDKIEASLVSQNDVMEDVRTKVYVITANMRRSSKKGHSPSPDGRLGSFPAKRFSSSSYDLQVRGHMTASQEEMPTVPGQPLETRGSIRPDRDPSIDDVVPSDKRHLSTKSLGFGAFRQGKKVELQGSMQRRQSEPIDPGTPPPSSPSGFDKQRRNYFRSKTRNGTSQHGAMDELEAQTVKLLQKDRRTDRKRSTQKELGRAGSREFGRAGSRELGRAGSRELGRAGSKEAGSNSSFVSPKESTPPLSRKPSPSLSGILPEESPVRGAQAANQSSFSEDVESEVKFGESDEEDDEQTEAVDHFPSSRKRILVRCRRISLEELRENYDSELVNRQGGGDRPSHTRHLRNETADTVLSPWLSDDSSDEPTSTALNTPARVLLALVGILDFKDGLLWRVLSFFSLIFPVALSITTMVSTMTAGADLRVFSTYICYFAGSFLATLSLRRAGITSLLGPVDHRLDLYAEESGFLEDWQRLSVWRLGEVMGLYVVMVSFRVISTLITTDVSYGQAITGGAFDIFPGLSFSLMILRLVMVCFVQLHICSGLELAIDSFGLRVFRDMDMEKALEEWNLVQATLRQCSGKLSTSMSIMGICCFGCLMFLAEQLLNNPELLQNLLQTALWMGWLYPPVLLFAYTMMRAAAVTEKASRVAPLVNSWKFEKQDHQKAFLMDHDRQYVVQYIIQSEAGFYMKGVRLTAGSVQKMSYYFAAFTFSLFARFWGAR